MNKEIERFYQQDRIDKLEIENAALMERLKYADKLIIEAKRKFAPHTTNSNADDYIEKYLKEKEK